jgi:VWFA-related protein
MNKTPLVLAGLLVALVILMAGCGGGLAPTLPSPDGGGVLPPGCQQVFYTVIDNGTLITNATQANFTFEEKAAGAEDSTYQSVARVCSWANNSGTGAANVVLVLDRSGSMSGQPMADLKAAAHQFVNAMRPGDRTGIVDFDNVITTTIDITSDKAALNAAIDSIDARGTTAVWDAGLQGLSLLNAFSGAGSKTLLLMTDGGDNASTSSPSDVVTAATTAGIPVFTIGFGAGADVNLQSIASGTGGMFADAANAQELADAFDAVQRSATSSYMVSWATRFATGDAGTLRITYTPSSPPIVITRDFTVR